MDCRNAAGFNISDALMILISGTGRKEKLRINPPSPIAARLRSR